MDEEEACPVTPLLDQLVLEIEVLWESHPVGKAFAALDDASLLTKQDPIYAYQHKLNDAWKKAREIREKAERGEITEQAAVAMLERRKAMMTEPLPEAVTAQMLKASETTPAVGETFMEEFAEFQRTVVEQIVSNNVRIASYPFGEAFNEPWTGPGKESAAREYLNAQDSIAANAELVIEDLREEKESPLEVINALLHLREQALLVPPRLEWKPTEKKAKKAKEDDDDDAEVDEDAPSGKADFLFKLYDEISTISEFSDPSRAARAGEAVEVELEAAGYLSQAQSTATEIKKLAEEHKAGMDISLHALTKILQDLRANIPRAFSAAAKIPPGRTIPKLHSPKAFEALAEIEGPEWKARQLRHTEDPTGFFMNQRAWSVLNSMGKDAKGLMVSHIAPGTGVIEGKVNDYYVGSNGKLTSKKRGT